MYWIVTYIEQGALYPRVKDFDTREEAWQYATEIVADLYPEVFVRDRGNPYHERTINVECHDGHWTAMFMREPQGVRGCPCGSSNISSRGAVMDLITRTNVESRTEFTMEDFTINIKEENNE